MKIRDRSWRIVRPRSSAIDCRLMHRDQDGMRHLWRRRLPWWRRLVSRYDGPELVPAVVSGGRWRRG